MNNINNTNLQQQSVDNQLFPHKISKDAGDPILLTEQDREKSLDILDSLAKDERTQFEVGGDEREDIPFDPDDEDLIDQEFRDLY